MSKNSTKNKIAENI
jgi:serine/threonine protein kinase